MATTVEGRRLTERDRRQQYAIRARVMRDVKALWRLVDPTDLAGTIGPFTRGADALIRAGYVDSAEQAYAYYLEFREAEGARARPAPRVVPPAESDPGVEVRKAGLSGIINARRTGATLARAGANGLVKVLATAGMLVLDGGRATLIRATQADPDAKGWRRNPSSGACYFCLMLASRGPQFKSRKSAGFEAHGNCACTAEVMFADDDSHADLEMEWQDVTAGLSGRDARLAWRRHVEAGRPAA